MSQAIENELSHSVNIPITIWWHKPLYELSRDIQRVESFWWHSQYNLATQAIKNELSRSGYIPNTIWWHKPLKTERVVLVTFPLQSGDTSHWKRKESFCWHFHFNLVTQAIKNGMSRSDEKFPLQFGDTSHWKRKESFWSHTHYNLATQAIKNVLLYVLLYSSDIPITFWCHKLLKMNWVILLTFPLQSGGTSHHTN